MKKFILFLLIYLLIPLNVIAYSDYIIASGENIGIELKSDYILIVGSYKINGYDALKDTPLKIGDKIIKINNNEVHSVIEMQKLIEISKDNIINITYKRGDKEYKTNLKLYYDNGEYKSGLYIKDTIRGVATLTYIDGTSFGALGHEILEKTTKSKFDISTGTIFASTVTGIIKSSDGDPGEKNAKSDSTKVYGTVTENTSKGIFGNYLKDSQDRKKYKVATPSEIKQGKAEILTVIDGSNVESFDINILRINDVTKTKNILFEITDKRLLDKTGGIIQGMSGSPIIQGDNIIGAVNYVVVDAPEKGYGIFITNMLEEAEN